jgi:hypothetical protein
MDFVPEVAAVYVKLTEADDPPAMVNVVGVNVPPFPPSDGVISVALAADPFGETVKFDEATPVVPAEGPLNDKVVAVPEVIEAMTFTRTTPLKFAGTELTFV